MVRSDKGMDIYGDKFHSCTVQQSYITGRYVMKSITISLGELIFSFIPMEGTNLELLQSTQPDGQIAKFVQKRGQGIHHIALEVDDVQAELERLKAKGVKLINEKPYRNAHQDLVAFIHPKSTFGVLIELIQSD